jgi:large subunit ribosomal protein LX
MSQVKLYRITGNLRKHGDKLPFKKEIRALKKEDAVQHLYSDMGSRHKARKFEIAIENIEEIKEQAEAAE